MSYRSPSIDIQIDKGMRAINPARITTSIFQRANKYHCCMGWAPADPRKHITMHHSINTMYLDLWEYGQYPDWVHLSSVPARTYEPQVLAITANALNQQLGTNITPEFLVSKRQRSWSKFLAKDLRSNRAFHEVYPSILGKLSQNIFVKQSRLTWVTEQIYRFDYSISSFDSQTPLTVGDFIDRYNQDIQTCVLASNFGFAAEIDQSPSALNKHEAQQQEISDSGPDQLQNLDQKHSNFINRFLAYIH